MSNFCHLHVHTQYSLLDGQASIDALIEKAQNDGMTALAVTDHGNMFGIKEFYNKVKKKNSKHFDAIKNIEKELQPLQGIQNPSEEENERMHVLTSQLEQEEASIFKPIIGCECYCARNGRFNKKGKEDLNGWHLIVLAKSLKGYKNLIKMVSYAWTEGFYGKPRIDKELLEKYHEGLIVSSACLAGEVPRYIQENQLDKAEESVLWFKNLFGDDYYLEMQRHETHDPNADQEVYPRQVIVNKGLVQLARKHNIKLIATNDVHFVNEDDAEAHDRLICLSTGKDIDDTTRLRYSKQEWLKTTAEMSELFADYPEAIANTMEIANKVEFYNIDSPALMPFFQIDPSFGTEDEYRKKYSEEDLKKEFNEYDDEGHIIKDNYTRLGGYEKVIRIKFEADYLEHLTHERAKGPKRYNGDIPENVIKSIDFELNTIKKMGFPGYFLIVQDFITEARKMGVSVGPGRGSAAGSVVAYCLGITDIDPLKYDLLFERFLNPDRISMPDIDIDFDDDGRAEVLKWVTEKYGQERVAHIITYGTMASKLAIKDVARVEKLPLDVSNYLAKLVPDRLPDVNDKPVKVNLPNCIKYVPEMKEASESKDERIRDTLKYACKLEGNVRNTGVHACGVIIGRQDISDIVPVATAEDKETKETLLVTQYEGSVIEETGLIKMDFLGLKTLSIIKEALENIYQTTGEKLDIDTIPLDDEKTYKLYCQGKTTCTFQFESDGMQKYLRELQPSKFEDLIAMNALYRPGPMDNIPSFIRRKQGEEEIKYDIPVMERYLKDTYGITVYQEQVMLLSRLLANFTRGQSDTLRKAMGKKQIAKMMELKEKFLEGGAKNGHDKEILEKIWSEWEKFASYAFNKSHATCYSWVAYQTAYLKAHYPSQYMAAVLSRNVSNIKEITKSMGECKSMGIQVLGPDVNESHIKFGVNAKGDIRFGLAAIKGVGEGAAENITLEREKNGPYKDIFDFVERISLSACNKKVLESLAIAGGFDSFGIPRETYVTPSPKNETFIEILSKYGDTFQRDKIMNSNSLFGEDMSMHISKPPIPKCELWNDLERLSKEKDLIGIFLSAHPLDKFHMEIESFTTNTLNDLQDLSALENKDVTVAGMVIETTKGQTKTGKDWGSLTLQDYSDKYRFSLFGNNFVEFGKYINDNSFLLVSGKVQEKQFWQKKDEKETDTRPKKELEFKIKKIYLLSEVKDDLIKEFTIIADLNSLDKELLQEIITNVKHNKGKTSLGFNIIDPNNKISVKMFSRTHRFKVNDDILNLLSKRQLKYKVN